MGYNISIFKKGGNQQMDVIKALKYITNTSNAKNICDKPFESPRDSVVISGEKKSDKEIAISKANKSSLAQNYQREKKWNVIFYLDGNNDLEPWITKGLVELEKVGSNKDVNVIAQLGRLSQKDLEKVFEIDPSRKIDFGVTEKDWSGARRYYVKKDNPSVENAENEINSPVLADLKEQNFSDPKTLSDFITWAMSEYKAKHTLAVLVDHGGGWRGAFTDNAQGEARIMSSKEIAEAFNKVKEDAGNKPDIIHMDACLMANAEIAYELSDAGKYYVASEEVGYEDSFITYGRIISALQERLRKDGDMEPDELAKFIVNFYKFDGIARMTQTSYGKYKEDDFSFLTHSAIDLDKMKKVKDELNNFAGALLNTPTNYDIIKKHIESSQHFALNWPFKVYNNCRDLFDIAEKIACDENITDDKLKKSAKILMKAINDAVVANVANKYIREEESDDCKGIKYTTGKYETHGISIYAPTEEKLVKGQLFTDYEGLSLSKDTQWNEFIKKLNS